MLWERFLGFDDRHFLNDHDWGFDEAEELEISTDNDGEDDILEERAVEDDQGGVDRY